MPDRIRDVADHFELRDVDILDVCGSEVDVYNLGVARWDKGRFFVNVVPNGDNQITASKDCMREVVVHECCCSQIFATRLTYNTLTHLCCDKGNAGLLDKSG